MEQPKTIKIDEDRELRDELQALKKEEMEVYAWTERVVTQALPWWKLFMLNNFPADITKLFMKLGRDVRRNEEGKTVIKIIWDDKVIGERVFNI